MKLSKKVPEVKEKIANGELSLTNASLAFTSINNNESAMPAPGSTH